MTVRTPNLPTSNLIDDLIGNMDGNTVRIAITRLAAILLSYQGPPYATRAQLFADLNWPAGAIATVWNDTAALNGVYRKSGSAGTGSWSRIGDLPTAPLTASQLSAKADVTALEAEATARIKATQDAGILPLANVAGSANAITAEIAPALPGVTLSGISTVELMPIAENTGNVTLQVAPALAWPVYRRDGSQLQAGDLKAGVSYLLRRRSNTWRLIGLLDSEVASAAEFRQSQRRVASRDVTLSTSTIDVKLPPGVNPIIDSNTLIEVLWPDAAWPVTSNTNITLRVLRSDGAVLRSGIARLDRSLAPGPTRNAWWTIVAQPGVANDEWKHVSVAPTQADVSSRALAVDVSARFAASMLGHRSLSAARDAAVTTSLRLVLPEEPSASERITVVVPEDSPGTGLSITTPARTRTVGTMTGTQTVPVASAVQFKAGDVLTLQVHDTGWFRLHHWWPGGRIFAEMQSRLKAAEADLASHKATAMIAVRQEGASLPARPNARYVEWFTWSDPSSRMKPWDKWVKLPNPTIPGIPTTAELRAMAFDPELGGLTAIRFLAEIEDKLPALTAIQYSVDGGAWRDLGAPPFGAGTIMQTAAMAPGDHRLRFRFANYLGTGEPSPERLIRAHGTEFVDDFSLAFAWTASDFAIRDGWNNITGIWLLEDGALRYTNNNSTGAASIRMTSLSAEKGAGCFVEGLMGCLSGTSRRLFLSLRPRGAGTSGDVWPYSPIAMWHFGTKWQLLTYGAAVLASGDLPIKPSNEYRLRAEVSADGTTVRAYVDGELVASVPNPAVQGTILTPSIVGNRPSGGGSGDIYLLDFRAGKVTA